MSRSALAASVAAAAVIAAVAVSGSTGPSPVATADAAAPFSVTKKQFTTVQKVSIAAVKRSNANTKAIAALQGTATTAGAGGAGPKGDPGPAGGFDPTKVSRVTGSNEVLNPIAAYNSTTVACPAGSIAIGGGWYLEAGAENGQLHVARSYPSPTLSSWSLRIRYTGAAAADLTPYAICAGA
jgi:hypothetical protein